MTTKPEHPFGAILNTTVLVTNAHLPADGRDRVRRERHRVPGTGHPDGATSRPENPSFKALLDPVECERFLNEARAVAKLDHPNIVALLDSGRDGEVCYMATEYIAGPTLRDWCAGRNGQPVPFRQVAQILLAISEAVAHAHGQGVLQFGRAGRRSDRSSTRYLGRVQVASAQILFRHAANGFFR